MEAKWKLIVEEYGKIEKAEIEVAPLTLFVGDNNSGKSYLMVLLWGISYFGIEGLLGGEIDDEQPEIAEIMCWMKMQIENVLEKNTHTICIGNEMRESFQKALNVRIEKNKDALLKKIFNYKEINIKQMRIEIEDIQECELSLSILNEKMVELHLQHCRYGFPKDRWHVEEKRMCWFFIQAVYSEMLGIEGKVPFYENSKVYMPAARTGFMLTKDIINKVGRNKTFNIVEEKEYVAPFIRPINQFLDVMNDLSLENKGKEQFIEIIAEIESNMTKGTVEISTLPNKEIAYVPQQSDASIPLRVASAVVTELSSLILILKHVEKVEGLFYEEPEMCLHPKLQQKMASVICQLVNANVQMVITTHSDIILTHINNMIKLSSIQRKEELLNKYAYTEKDLLKKEQVKVYQLEETNGKTKVKELVCGENGFIIPTFNNALDDIMDEAYSIQG